MIKIKPIKLSNGSLYVEMEEVDLPPLAEKESTESKFNDTPDDAELIGFKENIQETAAVLQSTINSLATDVAQALRDAAPTEWILEINIGFKGKTSPIPVLLSSEGNTAIKLTAKWTRKENGR